MLHRTILAIPSIVNVFSIYNCLMYLVYMIVDVVIMFYSTASLWSANISLLQCCEACLAKGELQCCEGGNW